MYNSVVEGYRNGDERRPMGPRGPGRTTFYECYHPINEVKTLKETHGTGLASSFLYHWTPDGRGKGKERKSIYIAPFTTHA